MAKSIRVTRNSSGLFAALLTALMFAPAYIREALKRNRAASASSAHWDRGF